MDMHTRPRAQRGALLIVGLVVSVAGVFGSAPANAAPQDSCTPVDTSQLRNGDKAFWEHAVAPVVVAGNRVGFLIGGRTVFFDPSYRQPAGFGDFLGFRHASCAGFTIQKCDGAGRCTTRRVPS
ncbi:hypothetical protein ACFYTQ_35280 [Nocardia sp. NPDC004068]|uniref:hypothetical protein n=1 Tax=Nocardia sp. NPDC004068 TaxID=3364303 RepID=UPI0036B777AF